jgi:branched-chain amino acid transport system ATP-binding protein
VNSHRHDVAAGVGLNQADALLSVTDLHVRLTGSHIVQGATFSVAPTGVTALLGRNGVGKTTTLRAIIGLIPSEGDIVLDGARISGLRSFRIVRCGVSYVPEDRDVFAGLTVAENLRLAELKAGEHRYDLVYDLFPDLKRRHKQLGGSLSGGQQQMLAIARGLLNPSKLLVIDEPTKGLAPRVVLEVVDALQTASEVTPMLLVEQNLRAIARLASAALVMAQGSIVYSGPAADLLGNEALTLALLGVASTKADRRESP